MQYFIQYFGEEYLTNQVESRGLNWTKPANLNRNKAPKLGETQNGTLKKTLTPEQID